MASLETRIARIAQATLAEQQYVTPIDVLIGLGWLAQPNVERWTWGRVTSLDRCTQVDGARTMAAVDALRDWSLGLGLSAWDTDYGDLQFTVAGDVAVERRFRTRWALAEQPAPGAPPKRSTELRVVQADYAWECSVCGEAGAGDLLLKARSGTMCLDCADLGHLEFLPSGDAALTRRAKKASRLSAVVVSWSRRRNRFERQGILAESDAIEMAAQQCLADADARAARRAQDQIRRGAVDEKFRAEFTNAIRAEFPGCPPSRAEAIAYHAALRGSGRVGRSAAGRALEPSAISLAVAASVRHIDTAYDDLLMAGVDRDEARQAVRPRVDTILDAWRSGVTTLDS